MNNRKSHYNKKGMYAAYDKSHKERQAEDYYSTPTEEVENILKELNIDFCNSVILEPACGGGHMVQGIINYFNEYNYADAVIATDIKERGGDFIHQAGEEFDFLSDEYPYSKDIDYIIMNPPFSLIEPFVMKSLGIANKGVLMFGRLQFLEGEKRYNKILKDFPPSNVYVYVDRIKCAKNGDPSIPVGTIQAYAWFYWNLDNTDYKKTTIDWIRRVDKK